MGVETTSLASLTPLPTSPHHYPSSWVLPHLCTWWIFGSLQVLFSLLAFPFISPAPTFWRLCVQGLSHLTPLPSTAFPLWLAQHLSRAVHPCPHCPPCSYNPIYLASRHSPAVLKMEAPGPPLAASSRDVLSWHYLTSQKHFTWLTTSCHLAQSFPCPQGCHSSGISFYCSGHSFKLIFSLSCSELYISGFSGVWFWALFSVTLHSSPWWFPPGHDFAFCLYSSDTPPTAIYVQTPRLSSWPYIHSKSQRQLWLNRANVEGVTSKKKKKAQCESCKLSFIWGKIRTIAGRQHLR